MKDIDSALRYLDTFIEQRGWKEVFEAYQTLKAAVLAQQANNKQSTPCHRKCSNNRNGICITGGMRYCEDVS